MKYLFHLNIRLPCFIKKHRLHNLGVSTMRLSKIWNHIYLFLSPICLLIKLDQQYHFLFIQQLFESGNIVVLSYICLKYFERIFLVKYLSRFLFVFLSPNNIHMSSQNLFVIAFKVFKYYLKKLR